MSLVRTMLVPCLLLAAASAAVDGNLLANPSVEKPSAEPERPSDWSANDYRTGGTWAYREGDAADGHRYLVLLGADNSQRSAWRQKVAVPAGTEAVAFGAKYRTRGVAADPRHGASLRILFHRSVDQWDEIGLKQLFFPPAETWTTAEGAFRLPEGTVAVVLEAFQFLSAGEVQFDDLWVKPIAADEVPAMPLPADLAVDREPLDGRNLPYSPAAGSTVQLNPPPFLWLPSGKDVTYRLEISPNADFSGDATIRRQGLTWAFEMLTSPLAPGTWYWRYGVDRPGETTIWSRTRPFEVTRQASPWPYPGRDALQVPQARPRLFITADELPEFRRRATEGDLKETADRLLRSLAGNYGEELVPEPDFLPADKTEAGWFYTKIFRETRPPMDVMERAAFAYLLTGDAQAGAEAKRRVLHFFSWDPHGSTSIFHNDEPAMWIMMRGSRAYDWTYDLYTPEERAKVESAMFERASDYYKQLSGMPFENNPYSSHPGRTIGFLGEAAISFLPDWPEARDWLEYITKIYWGVYPAWGKDDGGWNEGPGYWGAYMSFGLHFVVALKEATGINLAQRPFFHNTPYYRLYLTPPYSQMSPFGDGTQFAPSRVGDLMYWFSSLTDDPRLRWYPDTLGQDGGASILGVVLKDDSLVAQPPVDLPQGRLFEGVGLAVLHTDLADGDDNVMFALRSSPYGAVSHGHNDQNTFVIEAYGEPLAIATGYYPKYGSPHHDQWTRATKAKNGITFDGGEGQDRGWQAKGAITSFVHGELFDLIVGDATKAYGGRLTQAIREVVQIRPGLFVMRDRLASPTPRTFEYQLHALDEMTVDEGQRQVVTTRPKATMVTQFVSPAALTFSQHNRYDPEPETRLADRYQQLTWHLTAATAEPTTATEFLTVLSPAKVGDESARPNGERLTGPNAVGLAFTWQDGRRAIVAFREEGTTEPMQLGGLTSDGAIAAVELDAAGAPIGWLLDGGSRLVYGDRTLAITEVPTTLSAAVTPGGGRIDTHGPGGAVEVAWPTRPVALMRGIERVEFEGTVKYEAEPGEDRVEVWQTEPVPPGPVAVDLTVDDRKTAMTGLRYGRGDYTVSGRLGAAPGRYEAKVPAGATLTAAGGSGDEFWLAGETLITMSGRIAPSAPSLHLAQPATRLPAVKRAELPDGIGHEAEANFTEDRGSVEVSGGGHKHVSGGDNLWSWNTAGSTITWQVDAPRAGEYHLWFVGATETGLLAELRAGGAPQALWFEPTGGWGREKADEWRAFQIPSPVTLRAGSNAIALTNHSGLGLNLDRLVLVPRG